MLTITAGTTSLVALETMDYGSIIIVGIVAGFIIGKQIELENQKTN